MDRRSVGEENKGEEERGIGHKTKDGRRGEEEERMRGCRFWKSRPEATGYR